MKDLLRKSIYAIIFIMIHSLVLLCVLSIILYFINTKLLKYYRRLSWHINDLKMKTTFQCFIAIFWCILYYIVCIVLLFILRITNIGRKISLVILYDSIKDFLSKETLIALIVYGVTICSLLFCCLLSIMFLKHFLFKNFLKVHFYFVFLSLDKNHESVYLEVTHLIENIVRNITLFPQYIIIPFVKEE